MSLISHLFCCFRCPWNNQSAPKKPAYRPVDTAADDDDDLLEEPNSADLSGDDWIDDDTRLTVDGHESPKPVTHPPPKFSDKHQKHRIDSTNSQDNQSSTGATGLASLTSLFSKPANLKLPPPPLDVPSHYYKQREADEKRRREGEALEVVTVGEFVPNGNDLDIDAFYHDLQTNQPNSSPSANSTPSNAAHRQTSRHRSGVLNEMDLDDLLDELDVGGI